MSWEAFIPPMMGAVKTMDDGVGGIATVGIADKGRDIALHIQDAPAEGDAYILLDSTEARKVARWLLEFAEQIEEGGAA